MMRGSFGKAPTGACLPSHNPPRPGAGYERLHLGDARQRQVCGARFFLARRDGAPPGIDAIVNSAYNEYHHTRIGHFRFVSYVDDREVSHALVDAALGWLLLQGDADRLCRRPLRREPMPPGLASRSGHDERLDALPRVLCERPANPQGFVIRMGSNVYEPERPPHEAVLQADGSRGAFREHSAGRVSFFFVWNAMWNAGETLREYPAIVSALGQTY